MVLRRFRWLDVKADLRPWELKSVSSTMARGSAFDLDLLGGGWVEEGSFEIEGGTWISILAMSRSLLAEGSRRAGASTILIAVSIALETAPSSGPLHSLSFPILEREPAK